MKQIFLTVCLLLLMVVPSTIYGQGSKSLDSTVYQVMETNPSPSYNGGYYCLLNYIDSVFKYPDIYDDASIQGKVICEFIVTKEGDIKDIKVIQGLDAPLDNEIIRILKLMPKWISGKIKGKAVNVEYFLPVYCRVK